MFKALQTVIRERGLIESGQTVVVGVSGGADSTALAHLLVTLRDRLDFPLRFAHLNHRLRGADSEADEAFVCALGAQLDVPVITAGKDVAAMVKRSSLSLEMAARKARHDFFRSILKREPGVVALAHTRDDQAETLLLNLARGAGSRGLGGMDYRTELPGLVVIRPLLDSRRADLLRYLKRNRLSWREDESNASPEMLRNRVRAEVLPLLEKTLNPRVTESLARAADILRAEDRWMEEEARKLLAGVSIDQTLDGARLQKLPEAAQRRVAGLWLIEQGVPIEDLTYDRVIELVRMATESPGSQELTFPGGRLVQSRYGCCRIVTAPPDSVGGFKTRLEIPGETPLPELGLMVSVNRTRGFRRQSKARIGVWPAFASLNPKRIGRAAVYVRSRRAGDRMQPLGMKGSRKVQDILVDEKVPRDHRESIPLVVCRDEIVWIPGYRVARGWDVPSEDAPSLDLQFEHSRI